MAIDPRRLKPGELVRLMNSTPLGAVLGDSAFQRDRLRAGLRISAAGDHNKIDVFRYVAWLAGARADRAASITRHPIGSTEFAEAAVAAARKLSVSQLAQALGTHVNNVKYHTERGMPYSNDARGIRRFNEKECRKWLVDKGSVHYNGGNKTGAYAAPGRQLDDEKSDPNSPLNIELRLKRAKIDEIETKNAQRLGILVNAQECQAHYAAMVSGLRNSLEAIPVKAAAEVLAAIEGDHSLHEPVVRAVKKVVDAVMNSIAEANS